MYFWGVMYMIITTQVAIFKTEQDYVSDANTAVRLSIVKTYKLLFRVMKLPSIKMLVIILLTSKVGIIHIIYIIYK